MPKGSAPGERRGGRTKGTPNRITADIKALAQEYGAEAVEKLVEILRNSESDQAQIAAIKELLDRGFGKASQAVELSGAAKLIHSIEYTIVDPEG